MQQIKNRVIEAKFEDWREFEFLQTDNFKELDKATEQKIISSIISNNFTEVFYAWRKNEKIICIDGYQRINKIFPLLEKQGYKLPDKFLTVFIECANENEAAKLIMQYNSYYANVTQEGAEEHIKTFRLDLNSITSITAIPNIDLSDYLKQREYEQIEVHQEIIKPYTRAHVLLSFPPEKLLEVQNTLAQIKQLPYMEYEQSSN